MGMISSKNVPIWVIFIYALMMALGRMSGDWEIIKTIGDKIIRLKPIHGFVSETSAATIILTASYFGLPINTTHVISASIMGLGLTLIPQVK